MKMEGNEKKINRNERKINRNEMKINIFLRIFAWYPSILITYYKIRRLRWNLHFGIILRSADNAIRKKKYVT